VVVVILVVVVIVVNVRALGVFPGIPLAFLLPNIISQLMKYPQYLKLRTLEDELDSLWNYRIYITPARMHTQYEPMMYIGKHASTFHSNFLAFFYQAALPLSLVLSSPFPFVQIMQNW
jgi:hypothetical protein